MEVLAGHQEQRSNVQRQRGDAAPNDGSSWQQICSHALRGRKGLERAGDCAEIAAGPRLEHLAWHRTSSFLPHNHPHSACPEAQVLPTGYHGTKILS